MRLYFENERGKPILFFTLQSLWNGTVCFEYLRDLLTYICLDAKHPLLKRKAPVLAGSRIIIHTEREFLILLENRLQRVRGPP